MERRSQEPGLMLFIKRKLENSVPLREVREMLLRAGFTDKQIDDALEEVRSRFPDTHQDIVAGNSFLPPLAPKEKVVMTDIKPKTIQKPEVKIAVDPEQITPGLFNGRLRRHDFILGFLFFFGAGIVIISTILGFFTFIFPTFVEFTNDLVSDGFYGFWSLSLPILISPITIMLISLMWRRAHDLSLPGGIALGSLIFFVNPTNDFFPFYGILALQGMMVVIFFLLIAKRGGKEPNRYGDSTDLKGSIFARIFNAR